MRLCLKTVRTAKTSVCQVCHKEKRADELIPGALIRPSVYEEIKREYPHFDLEEYICLKDLEVFRYEQIRRLLEAEKGELSVLDQEILKAIRDHEMLTEAVSEINQEHLSIGEYMADKIAIFGGSWKFIIIFGSVLLTWMGINIFFLKDKAFDPYPFILLNLVLSTVAALQAPIIMMSQNRQAEKDRIREEHDYKTNLKAELEIRMLHEKMDKLMTSQWQRLIEIQQIQMDYMQQLSHKQK